jgi:hypothetical protein
VIIAESTLSKSIRKQYIVIVNAGVKCLKLHISQLKKVFQCYIMLYAITVTIIDMSGKVLNNMKHSPINYELAEKPTVINK